MLTISFAFNHHKFHFIVIIYSIDILFISKVCFVIQDLVIKILDRTT